MLESALVLVCRQGCELMPERLAGQVVFVGWANFAHADWWAASCPPYPNQPSLGARLITEIVPLVTPSIAVQCGEVREDCLSPRPQGWGEFRSGRSWRKAKFLAPWRLELAFSLAEEAQAAPELSGFAA